MIDYNTILQLEARVSQLEAELTASRNETARLKGRDMGPAYAPGVEPPARVEHVIPPGPSAAVAHLLEAARAVHAVLLTPRSSVAIQFEGAIAAVESMGRWVAGRWVL